MKILFIKKLYSPVGGSEALTHQWAHRLHGLGHQVRVLCLWPLGRRHEFPRDMSAISTYREFQCFDDDGVEVFQLAPKCGEAGKMLDLLPFSALIREDTASKLIAGFDVIHNICREYGGAAARIARERAIPLLLTPLPHPGQPFSGASPRDVSLYRAVQGIAAMTAHEKRWYQSLGVAADRIAVIGSGAVVGQHGNGAAFRRKHGIDGRLVLFVGRQEPYKGYLTLMAAAQDVWKIHSDVHFVFIGEKGLLSRFYELRQKRNARIIDLQVVDEAEKADAYAACDVFCMPSDHETFGLVYLEAWAYGKPVIGGDIPPLREVIRDGVDGLLVKRNRASVAQALIRLLNDPEAARAMGKAGQERVGQEFDWQKVITKLEVFYLDILAKPA